jgi:hypothetical protein
MAFMKKGLAPAPIKIVFQTGDRKDGRVWDGEQWVTEAEWDAKRNQK